MDTYRLFSSGYTEEINGKNTAGIKLLSFDKEHIKTIDKNNDFTNPSYILVDGEKLYTAEEIDENASAGVIEINENGFGKTKKFDAKGAGICHLEKGDKAVYASCYSGGALSVFNEDGEFINYLGFLGSSINKDRQEKSHLHSTQIAPNSKILVCADLGTDAVYKFNIDNKTGDVSAAEVQPALEVKAGSGPRHFAFAKSKKMLYLVCELSEALYSYSYDENTMEMNLFEEHFITGELNQEYSGAAADICINKEENRLYVSDRSQNKLHSYKIKENGSLEKISEIDCAGDCPRNISLSPDEKYLAVANQLSGNIAIFETDINVGIKANPIATISHKDASCVKWGI